MVKKRQADLDIGSITSKPQRIVTSLRDQNKVKKNKNTAPRGFNQFTSAAKDLLFGGKRLSKPSKPTEQEKSTDNSTQKQELSLGNPTLQLKLTRLSRSPRKPTAPNTTETRPSVVPPSSQVIDDVSVDSVIDSRVTRRRTRSTSSSIDLNRSSNTPTASSHDVTVRKRQRKSSSATSNLSSSFTDSVTNTADEEMEDSRIAAGTSPATPVQHLQNTKKSSRKKSLNASKGNGDTSTRSDKTSIQSSLRNLAYQTPERFNQVAYAKPMAAVSTSGVHVQMLWDLDDGSYVVGFTQRLEIRGMVEVMSLTFQGSVEIHGHSLGFGEVVKVFSPPGYHNGVIENHLTDEESDIGFHTLEHFRTVLPDLDIYTFTNMKMFHAENPRCVFVRFIEIEEAHLQPSIDLLPAPKIMPDYKALGPRLLLSECEISARYSQVTLDAVDYLVKHQLAGPPLRVVVCGAKNLGKSTLIRYIINKLLKHCDEGVMHLECDPSQCEFSPPGCLTLHTVTEPLLGPPWCHVADKLDHAELYGAISADVDPDRYVSCMKNLVTKYEKQRTVSPLVVSTMGWKQGLGLQLLASTVAEVNPTHVIQLCTDGTSYKNFPELTVFSVQSNDAFIPAEKLAKLHEALDYELIPLSMPHNTALDYKSDVLRPMLLRDLMMTAYLTRSILPNETLINDLTPYCVNMAAVAIDLGSDVLPAHLVCDAIHMQVMALCTAASDSVTSSPESDFLCVSDSAHLSVVGYGLIRAVDKDGKCLYVTTPLSHQRLSSVNVLFKIHGTITPETWLFQQIGRVKDDRGLPYIGHKKSGVGFVSTADAKYKYRKSRNPNITPVTAGKKS